MESNTQSIIESNTQSAAAAAEKKSVLSYNPNASSPEECLGVSEERLDVIIAAVHASIDRLQHEKKPVSLDRILRDTYHIPADAPESFMLASVIITACSILKKQKESEHQHIHLLTGATSKEEAMEKVTAFAKKISEIRGIPMEDIRIVDMADEPQR